MVTVEGEVVRLAAQLVVGDRGEVPERAGRKVVSWKAVGREQFSSGLLSPKSMGPGDIWTWGQVDGGAGDEREYKEDDVSPVGWLDGHEGGVVGG